MVYKSVVRFGLELEEGTVTQHNTNDGLTHRKCMPITFKKLTSSDYCH